ncbi:MAG TPA: glycoside hydrolase family 15 [Dermatophilaceae bacterium]|nr:glycoside hydrolase family 15 [Dermatophilaceae bacterium]
MRRGLAALAAAATAGALLATAAALVSDEPLPTLRNEAGWTSAAPFAPRDAGEALLRRTGDLLWLVRGRIPGPAERRPIVARALLDLRGLTRPNGATAAGPDTYWAYCWPRDTSFVAAAYAVSGHVDDAWEAFTFLASVQRVDGGFEARYLLDGSGVPDDRPRQSDGAGWVLWGLEHTRTAAGGGPLPPGLRRLRDRAAAFILTQTDRGRTLPPVSPDYWEVPERRLTLGTAAPLAAGLEAAAHTYAAEGDDARATDAAAAASRLRTLVDDHFGPDYQRHGGAGGLDAAVAMLMPPFTTETASAMRAWSDYPVLALRTAGGLAPGAEWKQDGVSWTPETALIAYTAAASGRVDLAEQWLEWLGRHVTPWGSLPEKVLPDGSPAGPAPLAWTAALVVLTEYELDVRRASVGPAGSVAAG